MLLSVAGRRLPPPSRDGAVAVALLAVGTSQVWWGWSDGGVGTVAGGDRLLRSLLVAVVVVPLAWRRRRPLAVAVVVACAVAVQVTAFGYVPFIAGLVPLLVVSYSSAAHARRARLLGLVLVLAAEAAMHAAVPAERTSGEVLFGVFVAVGSWIAGDVVRDRWAHADLAVASMRRAAVEARRTERARIARELHDVVAHSVSLMGVQAGAARTVMSVDPDRAVALLEAVEETARTSVVELQRLLAVLRDDDEGEPGRTPQPGIDELPALVESLRAAGLPAELHLEGDADLPRGLEVTAYRIVQEALTNALRHARARTVVHVYRACDGVRVEVRDEGHGLVGAPNPSGHGLIGMRERVQVYGGTLEAGAGERGFVVRAWLPADATVPR